MSTTQYIRWPQLNNAFTSIVLNGATSGAVTITVPAVVTSYTLTLPATQGGANTFLKNDGSGGLSWATGSGSGGFDSIGTFDTGIASVDGLNATGTTLFAQSADATHPGMVNTSTQTFAGNKTFSGTITLNALTASRAVVTNGSKVLLSSATTATEIGFVNGVTSSIQTQLDGKQATLTTGDLTDAGTDGITVTGGTGAVIGSGTSIAQHVADSTHNGYLSSADWSTFNGKQASGNYITALTGDATASGPGSAALTLATVNSNVGSFGSSTAIPSFTVNAKGLVTAASTNVVIAPAGTLTGTTLASNVVTSSLSAVGTIATGVWNGTTIAIANGGTGQTAKTAAFDALSPLTTGGDLLYGGSSGTGTRLANGGAGQVLTSGGGTAAPTWGAPLYFPPTVQTLTSGSGTYNKNYNFVITSGSATVGATYTNNAVTFTVYATVASATKVVMSGSGAPASSGTLTKASGTGDSTITFSQVVAPLYLVVELVGGGGGGGGSALVANANGGTGGTGGITTFGSSLLTGNGGVGGSGGGTTAGAANGGAGGTASIGTGGIGRTATGSAGGGGAQGVASTFVPGGSGGTSPFAGAGTGGDNLLAGITNSGSGGGGAAGQNTRYSGGGGGSGGFVRGILSSPSATYAYAVGAAGTAGIAGTSGTAGAAGGSGFIYVEEHYQ